MPAWLLFATGAAQGQRTPFSFYLDEPCKTSAGVFAPDGTLVRTLWSKARYYAPGTYSAVWDGLDDNGNAASAGIYQIRVLQHNTEYVWDGAIGNTSAELSGPTVHGGFWPMADMAISGTNAFYVSGYNEGKYDFRSFLTTDPQHVKMAWYWVYTAQFNRVSSFPGEINDLNWLWVAADGNWVYFACSGTPNPNNTTVPNTWPGCIVACNVGDNSPAYFANGVQIVNNGANSPLPSGIYVGTQPGLSGLAVQQNGNLLAGSVAPDNKVYLFDKRSGAATGGFNVSAPGRLSFSPDGSLWVISGNSVICYSNPGSNPTAVLTIPNFTEPLAVAVHPSNPNIILVADGGASQQVKAYNSAGASLWTYGLAGGYASNGVAVATNKFWFNDGENDETFLTFAPDGSFWVGDGGNDRSLHFSSDCNYIEQIMYQPHSYLGYVDQNNPSRVFSRFLEFNVDYTKPLPQSWTLVNNWKVNVPAVNIDWDEGLYEVTTFPNGRTYALIDNETYPLGNSELCELVPNQQLRLTGIDPAWSAARGWISFGPDGSARRATIGIATWYEDSLAGYDANNNPIWNPDTLIASAPNGGTDPVPRDSSFGNVRATISSNNILISFDQSLNNGWHLGGIRVGASQWLWKASPAVGSMNGCGTYEISNGVAYGGNTVQAVDRNVIYGYHGEFFRGQGQAGQTMHFYDDGLFVGQFGEANPGHYAYEGALPGFAGNGHSPNLVKTSTGDYYLWVNDESDHGMQRWHLVNARNIREQAGMGALGSAITLTNQPGGFPTCVTGKSGNQSAELSWLPVPGAASYSIRYSLMNGGPYNVLAGSTASLDYVAGGLTNGQTYYFAVTAIQSGTEGIASEQVAVHPFDTSQNVFCAGSMTEGGEFTPVIDASSSALTSGRPSYAGAEHYTGVLNLRELDYYGYGNLQNENVGTEGYVIYDWQGPGTGLTNIPGPFTVTPGSGWYDVPYLARQFRVDNVLGAKNGLIAGPAASMSIAVSDTNFHYLTVVSPAQFNNPRVFTIQLASANNAPASYALNENPGLSHVFQFLFRGNVTLSADATVAGGSDAIVQALFLDNAPVTYLPPSVSTTQSLIASTTAVASSQNPALAGSLVTFTAAVSGSGGVPTGTVAFLDGSSSVGAGTVNSSGVASWSTSALSAGGSPHSITAVYGGDSRFGGSTSGVLSQSITNMTNINTNTPTGGLSASWPLNEGAGTTVGDSSGNGNTGTLKDSPLWVAGLAGHDALEFPGASMPGAAYVTVPGSATLADLGMGSNLTICAWVKRSPDSVGNYCSVVAKDVLNDSPPYHRNYELIFDTGGHILFVYRNSAGTSWEMYASSAAYTDTANWHFYCVTYTCGSAASCALYVDGAAVSGGWVAGNGSYAPASTSGGPVLIGTDGTGTASHGSIYDGISIYSVILSASRVLALYNSGIGSRVASTTAVASSQNPAAAGSTVTFTATVSGTGGTPTGTVVFHDGTDDLGSGTLNSSGVTSLSTGALSSGGSPHSITAVYCGDSTFGGSTSSVLSQIITNADTSTAAGATVSIPLVNASFESPAGAQGSVAGKPAGWVASNSDPYGVYNPAAGVYVNVVNDILPPPAQGSQVLWINAGNYLAQFLTNTLAASQTYTLSGAIGNRGDGYGMLASDQEYVALVAGSTTIAENTNLPHPAPGSFLPWTISYTAPAAGFPTGPLQIRLGQAGVGEVNYDNITLTAGTGGTNTVIPATNSVIPSTTTLASSQNPAPADGLVTFTATVSGSGGVPSGTVAFFDGGASLGAGTLNGSGQAALSTAALLAAGSPHSITAVYGGDSAFGGSASSMLPQIISNAGTNTNAGAVVTITVVNPSFESPAGAQGTVAGKPVGWVASNSDPYGVYNPSAGVYTNEVNDILPAPAEGSQVLWINAGNYLAQFLTNTLAANQTYTLSGAIGNRGDGYGMLPTDREYVDLLAGSTIIAQNTNLAHPAPGSFLPWTISYTAPAAGFPAGPLQIRLGQDGAGEVNYDNITLTAGPAAP